MKLALDTNIYYDYAEGIPDTVDIIAKNIKSIYIPSVVIGELLYGFMKGSKWNFNNNKLRQVIHRLDITIINVDQNVAKKYAIIYKSLAIKGKKIPINDVWIAACCMEVGGSLITRDKHFKSVEQIESIIMS
ncbi:MAG: type II toxin-antitoxin system VapC family toxin [Candidatus Anammoxibacter sp.]